MEALQEAGLGPLLDEASAPQTFERQTLAVERGVLKALVRAFSRSGA